MKSLFPSSEYKKPLQRRVNQCLPNKQFYPFNLNKLIPGTLVWVLNGEVEPMKHTYRHQNWLRANFYGRVVSATPTLAVVVDHQGVEYSVFSSFTRIEVIQPSHVPVIISRYPSLLSTTVTNDLLDETEQATCFKVVVSGSGRFAQYELLCEKLDKLLSAKQAAGERVAIVSSGGTGAEALAEMYASERSLPVIKVLANWQTDGANARFVANGKKIAIADACVVFNPDVTTESLHLLQLAKEKSVPVRSYENPNKSQKIAG